ncbi:MAG: threonine synthase [Phycisphaerales bacterium JB038]
MCRVPEVSLDRALLQGQAADKGLFLPEQFPQLTRADLLALRGKPYADVAHAVLKRFTRGVFDDAKLHELCADAYDYDVPLEHVTQRQYVMRLDQGPTASFKDFAARMMARWMGRLMEKEQGELVILTATSGDTGSAVAHAYHGVDRVHTVVLFPIEEVSDRQRKQMTTIGGNVATIGIEGKFDEGQALVKRAFADPDLAGIRLTSANSINIGRLLPQAVYYIYSYLQLADVEAGEEIIFSVPSGNFGDMMGGVIARHMGLPIRKFIISTNANDEVPNFIETGEYRPLVPSRVCISNAMNVGHPSNLARLIDMYGGQMDEVGKLHKKPDMDRLRRDIWAVSIDDNETRATLRTAWQEHELLLEPHGAVGWAGLQRYLSEHEPDYQGLAISLETAHPAKVPEEIEATINITPDTPPSLQGLEDKTESYPVMPVDYDTFRDHLKQTYGR